ncbi:MAG: thiamine pyrophosphate-dependent enzyme [Candidatus Eisenbacteria bacterium]|nr:thiamine pyrophosphate-dependent enzyme [Candidatus Eisenbacteria bacterium]
MTDVMTQYCPGCGHGIIHRIVGEVIDELGLREKTIGVSSVGCSVFADEYYNFDFVQSAHGRAPAVATGLKRILPDCAIFTYQGDGDLISIGTAEIVHAAARGEKITAVFVNNAIYGMTGGQMAPTTLLGMKTTTSPLGRDPARAGFPIRVCELLSSLEGAVYLARTAVNGPPGITKTKRAMKKAFQAQLDGKGFSLVEVLSQCPTDWGMVPLDATKWVDETMAKCFPLGEVKDTTGTKKEGG